MGNASLPARERVIDESFAHGLVGVTLDGRYRLDAVLGEGGMGSVFRATQLAMDRKVAVKLLKPHLAGDQAALERFAREARATLKVESPHAVKILDFGVTPHRDYYMVLEYLDGRTVQREIEIDGPFAPARVAHIARQALHALGAAHVQGLIHRDVKPDNLLLMRIGADGDYTKILDFGVAKLMQGAAGDPALLGQTAAGVVFGTPQFMSPEQALGQPLDGRSDLYSLAATMFTMLTGTSLFQAATAIEWLTHHAQSPPPQLATARPELATYPELDALLQRCLAKHRDQRPETAGEMAQRIAELEPALARLPADALRKAGGSRTPSHPSSYVQVLRDRSLASTAVIALPAGPASGSPAPASPEPGSTAAPLPGSTVAPHAGSEAAPPGAPATPRPMAGADARPDLRRRHRWLGGIALASLAGVVLGLSIDRKRPSRPTGHPASPPVASTSDPPPLNAASRPETGAAETGAAETTTAEAGIATLPIATTARPDSIAPAAPPEMPAASPPPSLSQPTRPKAHPIDPARKRAAEQHLRNAEDAFRSNHPLRQLAEADLALRADPRSVRARYLLGDALIRSGDLDRGCSYLAAIKRIAAARERARAAGCPGD